MHETGNFPDHTLYLRVEGFQQEKLLTRCLKEGFVIKNIQIINDTEMCFWIMSQDYAALQHITQNRYRITVLKEAGIKPMLHRFFLRRSTAAGLLLFCLILFYQSTFVSEIRISGYEKFTESEIRASLRAAGLYEGCSKRIDLNEVKLHLYRELDNIAWIGVKYIGNLAEIKIVEGTEPIRHVEKDKPNHVVADKEGYVDRIIAREGLPNAVPGQYVKPGDILITGIIPLRNTAYGTPDANLTERYVHAAGEVYVKVPYYITRYQEKFLYAKTKTGKRILGIHFEIGDLKINTAKDMYRYENSIYTEKQIFRYIRPIPVFLAIAEIDEVDVSRQEKSQTAMTKEANLQIRQAMKEKIPDQAQILNKSLKFSSRENIIEVAILLETLEKIGIEKEIVIGNPTDRGTENQNRP